MNRLLAFLLGLLGCVPQFIDTTTPAGVPNLVQFAPGMFRMGQPPAKAWPELLSRIDPTKSGRVVLVKLNDEVEGDDSPGEALGVRVVTIPLPPEDDQIWTVFVKPDPKAVRLVVDTILAARAQGAIVAWHCSHGRDRTGLVSALVGMRLLGWTKEQAWKDMLAHGFRWELPDLDTYWLENVP